MKLRQERREALEAARKLPQAAKDAFCDLLQSELLRAWNELETAQDSAGIWRAQGKAREIRDLLGAITK